MLSSFLLKRKKSVQDLRQSNPHYLAACACQSLERAAVQYERAAIRRMCAHARVCYNNLERLIEQQSLTKNTKISEEELLCAKIALRGADLLLIADLTVTLLAICQLLLICDLLKVCAFF